MSGLMGAVCEHRCNRLLQLPYEILQRLISGIDDTVTLINLGASCRTLRRLVYEEARVWRNAASRMVDRHVVATMLAQYRLVHPSGESEPPVGWWFRLCVAAGSRRPRLKVAEQLTRRMLAGRASRGLWRSGHTATAVLEHYVLVLGGVGAQFGVMWDPLLVDLATMAVTRPTNRSTTPTKPGQPVAAPSPRLRHTACAIDKHRLVVFGGYALDPVSARGDCFICEVASDAQSLSWTRLRTAGEPPSNRYHHICGVFDGGSSVVVYGGEQNPGLPPEPPGTVYCLDLATLRWSKRSSTGPRPLLSLLQMSLVHRASGGDRLVVFGGMVDPAGDDGAGDVMVVHSLNLSTLVWSTTLENRGAAPRSRTRSAFVQLGPDALLVLGGGHSSGAMDIDPLDDAVRLDLGTDTWSR